MVCLISTNLRHLDLNILRSQRIIYTDFFVGSQKCYIMPLVIAIVVELPEKWMATLTFSCVRRQDQIFKDVFKYALHIISRTYERGHWSLFPSGVVFEASSRCYHKLSSGVGTRLNVCWGIGIPDKLVLVKKRSANFANLDAAIFSLHIARVLDEWRWIKNSKQSESARGRETSAEGGRRSKSARGAGRGRRNDREPDAVFQRARREHERRRHARRHGRVRGRREAQAGAPAATAALRASATAAAPRPLLRAPQVAHPAPRAQPLAVCAHPRYSSPHHAPHQLHAAAAACNVNVTLSSAFSHLDSLIFYLQIFFACKLFNVFRTVDLMTITKFCLTDSISTANTLRYVNKLFVIVRLTSSRSI